MFISRRNWAALGVGVLLAVTPTAAGAAVRMDGPPAPPVPSVGPGNLPNAGDLGSINPNDDGKSAPGDDDGGSDSPAPTSKGPLPVGNQGPGGGNQLPSTNLLPQTGGQQGGGQQGQGQAPADQDQPSASDHQSAPDKGSQDKGSQEKGADQAPQSNSKPNSDQPANPPLDSRPAEPQPSEKQSTAPQSKDSDAAPQDDSSQRDSRSQVIAPQKKQGPVRTGHSRKSSRSAGHQRTHRSERSSGKHSGQPWWSDGGMNPDNNYGGWDDDNDGPDNDGDGGGGGGAG